MIDNLFKRVSDTEDEGIIRWNLVSYSRLVEQHLVFINWEGWWWIVDSLLCY